MQRRGFFGFISGFASLFAAGSARADVEIPPVTGIRRSEWKRYVFREELWVIDQTFRSSQQRPNHRPEMFRQINRAAYIQHAEQHADDVQRLIALPEGVSPLHDHPRSHMKLPPVDPNRRTINAGYLPGTEPPDTFPA